MSGVCLAELNSPEKKGKKFKARGGAARIIVFTNITLSARTSIEKSPLIQRKSFNFDLSIPI